MADKTIAAVILEKIRRLEKSNQELMKKIDELLKVFNVGEVEGMEDPVEDEAGA